MIPIKIKDANATLGKPDNWDESRKCDSLSVRREVHEGVPVMLSEWKPSAVELEIINRGGGIFLGVVGEGHPPVYLYAAMGD